jgi:hypothetical protein
MLPDYKVNYAVNYRASYARNKITVFSEQTQSVLLKRTALGGFRAKGSFPPASAVFDIPSISDGRLVDQDFLTGISAINLNNTGDPGLYHNIGIEVPVSQQVESLFVVNRDITSDANLTNPVNWQVYMSDFNAPVPDPIPLRV